MSDDEIKYESYPIPGIDARGGQTVGGNAGVRATHVSTGTTAYVNVGRSQHVNKMIAEEMILSAITHPKFR